MTWGQQIDRKFNRNGEPLRYPGNTVISDLRADNPAFALMDRVRELLRGSALSGHFILLPRESYHMTVIRGLNDLVRTDGFWPDALSRTASMEETDAYVARAVASVPGPGTIRMRFGEAMFDDADVWVRLYPLDAQQQTVLDAYRDAVADALGMRLPGHNSYRYHFTLAYVLRPVPPGHARTLAQLKDAMDAVLKDCPEVRMPPPHMAYYRDMHAFYAEPIVRDAEGEHHA